jgi:GT2 family glycosyltransferase
MLISASIVTYNTSYEDIRNLIDSLTTSVLKKLYVIENSPVSLLKNHLFHSKIVYIFNPSNPGFGKSHNIALIKSLYEEYDYHFIINPDIHLSPMVISGMVLRMEADKRIGMMMPRIVFPDGKIQYLPKLLPTPFNLIGRKFKRPKYFYNKLVNRYELRFVNDNLSYSCPIISGCFTLLRLTAIEKIGYYDDAYFMYFEDWDLSRRMHRLYKTIYLPDFLVIHEFNSGANKNIKLFFAFLKSLIIYFNKWGWFFDKERVIFNKNTLNQFIK